MVCSLLIINKSFIIIKVTNKNKSYSVDEALSKLQHYCSYQERCHQEVRHKLRDMRMIPEAIDMIIVSLIDQDYLNESRYANTFVSGKFRIKKWGIVRLSLELRKKDISKININQAIAEIDPEEYIEVFNDLARKRLNQLKETNKSKKKKKLIDYLLYRGWEPHLVYDKANTLIK